MSQAVTFQDVVKFKPKNLVYISENKWNRVFRDKSYYSIIEILMEGTKSAEEIYKLFPQTEKKKSDITIYRYIKELIKEEIVAVYGRRLRSDNVASKKIYGLAAKLFIPANENLGVWLSERGSGVTKKVGYFLNHNFENKNPEPSALASLFHNFETKNQELEKNFLNLFFNDKKLKNFTNLLNVKQKESIENGLNAITHFNIQEIIVLFNLIRWIPWYIENDNYDGFLKNLASCFKSQNNDLSATDTTMSEEEEQDQNTTDLINYIQKPIYFGTIDQIKYTWYSLHHAAIIDILKTNNPLTIKEIHSKHHTAVIERIGRIHEKCTIIGEETPPEYFEDPQPKVENTIYRYIKELIDKKLVVEAGRRIDPDSPTTSILYTSVSKQFIFFEDIDEFWNFDEWDKVITSFGAVITLILQKTSFDSEKFKKIITKIEKEKFNSLRNSLQRTDNSEKISDFMKNLHYAELNASIKIVGLLEWLLNNDNIANIKEDILSCFK
ncbi:MAG: hypothetical protein HeimC3_19210 [Candidatus Heimdallarchaeota archaeon LC_3]|nr:MAG: hypothetical protein HeimC3_19210 [Candidatus Heimdallarchaeota archaeon LC_3]